MLSWSGQDDGGQSRSPRREQRAGVGQTTCKYKCVGPGRERMSPKCESSSVFLYGPHPNNKTAPPSTKALTCALRARLHMAFWKRLSKWESDFQNVQLLQGPDPFCLSVLSFSVPTPRRTQFPIVSVFPLLLSNRALLFIPWVMAWKYHQLGIWDVGCRTGWHKAPEKGRGGWLAPSRN